MRGQGSSLQKGGERREMKKDQMEWRGGRERKAGVSSANVVGRGKKGTEEWT